jgi:hypothetical protein
LVFPTVLARALRAPVFLASNATILFSYSHGVGGGDAWAAPASYHGRCGRLPEKLIHWSNLDVSLHSLSGKKPLHDLVLLALD